MKKFILAIIVAIAAAFCLAGCADGTNPAGGDEKKSPERAYSYL